MAERPTRTATEAEMAAFRRGLAELLAVASERRAKRCPWRWCPLPADHAGHHEWADG